MRYLSYTLSKRNDLYQNGVASIRYFQRIERVRQRGGHGVDPHTPRSLPSLSTAPPPPPPSMPLSTSPPLAAPPSSSLPPPQDLEAAAAMEAGVAGPVAGAGGEPARGVAGGGRRGRARKHEGDCSRWRLKLVPAAAWSCRHPHAAGASRPPEGEREREGRAGARWGGPHRLVAGWRRGGLGGGLHRRRSSLGRRQWWPLEL
jgi:hypothetical protein